MFGGSGEIYKNTKNTKRVLAMTSGGYDVIDQLSRTLRMLEKELDEALSGHVRLERVPPLCPWEIV